MDDDKRSRPGLAPRGGPLAVLRDRLAGRSERLLAIAERAAELELRLLERLEPIVDNLGELVRLQLEEARARRRERTGGTPEPGAPRVIDVTGRPSRSDTTED